MRTITVCAIVAALAMGGCRRAGREPAASEVSVPPLPQVSGSLPVEGVSAPVVIARDHAGIPHISAAGRDDLFFAQGFVQAQDRLFQMDLWRRAALGRLSEVLGANFIERDAMTRRIQYPGSIDDDWAAYGDDTRAIVTAFTRGINAWVDLTADHPPEEFALAGWRPEHWAPEDLLNRTDAFLASADAQDEAFRAQVAAAVGERAMNRLLGEDTTTRFDPQMDPSAVSPMVIDLLRRAGAPPFFSALMAKMTPVAASNAWAIGPRRSAEGVALLAADPHRQLSAPGARYLVHLRAPGWNVAGATAPWLPGVAIGHNEQVAWAMTAFAADTQDLYVEQVNPANPRQVMDRGRWVTMTSVADSIAVKGRTEPYVFERLYTPRGVVIGEDRVRNLAFTLRWSGQAPGTAAELAALTIDRADSAASMRQALAQWKMPAAEFVFADAAGAIGRQVAALVPRRVASGNSRGRTSPLPLPGWTGEHDWRGWIPWSDLPNDRSSPGHVVVSANSNIARTRRLNAALAERPSFSVDDFKMLQADVHAWNADRLVPLLNRVRGSRPEVEAARLALLAWDRRITVDPSGGMSPGELYVAWESALVRRLAALRLPEPLRDGFISRASNLTVPALTNPTSDWFDPPVDAGRDAVLLAALADAAGAQPRPAAWFLHPLAVTTAARARFNVGPFQLAGYPGTVMANSSRSGGVAIGSPFRLIVPAGKWDEAVVVNAPGQSEWTRSAHYRDHAEVWTTGGYVPLPFSDAAITAATTSVLTLVPAESQRTR